MNTSSALKIAGILEVNHGKPVVSSLTIAEEFGRPHFRVLKSIKKLVDKGTLTTGVAVSSWTDTTGRNNTLYLLDERSALIAMPFIGGAKAEQGQTRLVDAYLWYRSNFANPPRQDLLSAKRAAHHPMMDALVECREEQGKLTATHHFTNENRLCNGVVTGNFRAIDEQALDNEQLNLLTQVRERNAALLVAGLDYDTRKARLVAFATRLRTRQISHGPAIAA